MANVTSTDATLEAQVNVQGAPNGVYYQFELVKNTSEYAAGFTCLTTRPQAPGGCPLPQEPGGIPILFLPGNSMGPAATLTASVDLGHIGVTLEPGTTYHYRLLIARRVPTEDTIQWEEPIVYGPDQTFTTPSGPPGPPTIVSESVSHVTSTDAVLEATLNDQDLEATYEFHLVTAPPCFTATPPCERPQYLFSTPAGKLLGSSVSQSVSVDLNSAGITLSSGERYEYWVTATSSAGTTQGADQVLIAPEEPATPATTALSSIGIPAGGPLATPTSTVNVTVLRPSHARTTVTHHRKRRHHKRRGHPGSKIVRHKRHNPEAGQLTWRVRAKSALGNT